MTVLADGCWADYRTSRKLTHGRPCLFLDRDGVLIEDTGYPHDPEAIVLVPEALAAVATAQRAGFVAGLVSNQSGVGRGYFDWPAFTAVQAAIDAALGAAGAKLDFVLACPHHPEAALAHLRGDHPWRKPRPGMLAAAREALGLDPTRSIMLGDRASDMTAAAGAQVMHRLQLGDEADAGALPHGARGVPRARLDETIHPLVRRTA